MYGCVKSVNICKDFLEDYEMQYEQLADAQAKYNHFLIHSSFIRKSLRELRWLIVNHLLMSQSSMLLLINIK